MQAESPYKKVLSLGRLHPLKGLDLLVSAWAEVKSEATSYKLQAKKEETEEHKWVLVIVGPDEQGTKERLKDEIQKIKLKWCESAGMDGCERDADIVFWGAVHEEEKWALMQRADIFVLPSRSENFGMVVGEALSCGVPVVTTAVGPWGERGYVLKCESSKAGRGDERSLARADETRGLIIVETSVEGVAAGLRQMMALSDAERREIGQNGCEWVKREFSWESVAKQMLEAYGVEDK